MRSAFRVVQSRGFSWPRRLAHLQNPGGCLRDCENVLEEGHQACFKAAAGVGPFSSRTRQPYSLSRRFQDSLRLQPRQLHSAARNEAKENDILEEGDVDGQKVAPATSRVSAVTDSLLRRLQVPRNQSVLPILLEWIQEGNKLERRQIKAICSRFIWQKRFSQGLEISEWVIKERPFELLEPHYAFWLFFVGKVLGPSKAEEALSQIPLGIRKRMIYCKLLDIYLEYNKIDEAIGIPKRMRELGIRVQTYVYNNLITYYDRNALQSKIPILLEDMKEQGVAFNRQTYNILIGFKAKSYDMEGLEADWEAMKADPSVKPDCVTYLTLASAYLFAGLHKKAELAIRDAEKHLPVVGATYKYLSRLMILYGSLGKVEDVGRIYQKIRESPGYTCIPIFVLAMEAYGEVGSVESAEMVMREMEVERGWHHLSQFNTSLGVYCKNGLMEKAEEVLQNLIAAKHKPNVITFSHLLVGYLKTDQMGKAMETFMLVLKEIENFDFNWETFVTRAWLHSARNIIDLFAQRGDIKHAELLLKNLEGAKLTHYPKAYNSLLKTYEKAFKVSHSESH